MKSTCFFNLVFFLEVSSNGKDSKWNRRFDSSYFKVWVSTTPASHPLGLNIQYKEAFLHEGKLESCKLCLCFQAKTPKGPNVSKESEWSVQKFIRSVKNLFCISRKEMIEYSTLISEERHCCKVLPYIARCY